MWMDRPTCVYVCVAIIDVICTDTRNTLCSFNWSQGTHPSTLLIPQKDSKVSGQVSVSRNRVDTVLLGTQALRWEPDWCPLWCLTSAGTRKSQNKAKPSTPANQKQWVLM